MDEIDDSNFLDLSERKLSEIFNFIDDNDQKSVFDVEYSDGILTISYFKDNKTYVINKHAASKKIWFSSPVSGADYFSYHQEKQNWFNKNHQEISQILFSELNFN